MSELRIRGNESNGYVVDEKQDDGTWTMTDYHAPEYTTGATGDLSAPTTTTIEAKDVK